MYSLLRSCLAGLLVALLVTSPVAASPARALGSVLQAEHAFLGSAPAVAGATVFAGDQLLTDAGGTLRVRLGAAQIYLLAASTATLDEAPGGFSAALSRGTIEFASSGDEAVWIRYAGVVVRPKTTLPTHGQVSIVAPNVLLVSSFRNPLEVSVGAELYTVAEASSYRVVLEPDPQEPEGVGKRAAKRTRAAMILVGLGTVGAITGIIIWRALISAEGP